MPKKKIFWAVTMTVNSFPVYEILFLIKVLGFYLAF